MHVRIRTFEASAERLDQVVAFFRDAVVQRFSQHEGFVGYQALVDRSRGRVVGISWWTTLAALEASGATAQRSLHEAEGLGAITLGDAQILEVGVDTLALC